MRNSTIPDFPQRVVLELTAQCNLRCAMCPRNYIQEKNGYMAEGLWKRLIDEIAVTSPGTIILPFWRGESLLHPNFTEFVRYALDKSLPIHLSTNGHLVTEQNAAILAGCEFVTFSIHAQFGYDKAREFLSIRKGNTPVVQVSFVAGEATERILRKLVESRDLEGFDSVRLYEEHTKDGVFGKSTCRTGLPRRFCPKLQDTLVIAFDGAVSRCNHIWETENGVSLNTQDIKDAWRSNRLQYIRQHYPDNHCAPCDQWTGHTRGESWRIAGGRVEHKVYEPADAVSFLIQSR